MYYKTIKSNLTFNEAIDSFKQRNIIRCGSKVIDPSKTSIDSVQFSIDEITSNDWEILGIDSNMMQKLDEVRDMMYDINLDIDSRFHNEELMNISSYWNLFENQFVLGDDNLQYEFMKFYVNNYKK